MWLGFFVFVALLATLPPSSFTRLFHMYGEAFNTNSTEHGDVNPAWKLYQAYGCPCPSGTVPDLGTLGLEATAARYAPDLAAGLLGADLGCACSTSHGLSASS